MKKKKLPIGIQTFANIRDKFQDYIYVDKTDIAYNLITKGKFYFLSRPRRFGKSLFLDTLSEIFKGNKHYFEGLAIYNKWDWTDIYPVIKISFGSGSYQNETLINNEFKRIFNENNYSLDLKIEYNNILDAKKSLDFLIFQTYIKFNKKVVVLVDEYDKLIIDNIANEDKQFAKNMRSLLRNFYSALKDNEDKLQFVFLTGVSKFSKLNLFSGLNNIEDITLNKEYSTITGYTHFDIQKCFADYLSNINLEQMRLWYNGYNYFGEPIYNPFDILLFFSNNGEYSNYWWETGNPSFLVEMLKKGNYYLPDLENITVTKETLSAFDIEHIDIVAILWQTGYLTFDKKIDMLGSPLYKMKIPNIEIQQSLNSLFFDYLTNLQSQKASKFLSVYNALNTGDLDLLYEIIHGLFSSISYQNYVKNTIGEYEGYYASVVFAFLSSIGAAIITEDYTNKGRIDMTLKLPTKIYIIEFKVDKPNEASLYQIKNKKYYEKYILENKEIYLVGIHFSSTEKNINQFEWEKM